MKKIWLKKFNSFSAAEEFDRRYYLQMGKKRRLETVQFLRECYSKFSKGQNEGRTRLRRVIKIVQ